MLQGYCQTISSTQILMSQLIHSGLRIVQQNVWQSGQLLWTSERSSTLEQNFLLFFLWKANNNNCQFVHVEGAGTFSQLNVQVALNGESTKVSVIHVYKAYKKKRKFPAIWVGTWLHSPTRTTTVFEGKIFVWRCASIRKAKDTETFSCWVHYGLSAAAECKGVHVCKGLSLLLNAVLSPVSSLAVRTNKRRLLHQKIVQFPALVCKHWQKSCANILSFSCRWRDFSKCSSCSDDYDQELTKQSERQVIWEILSESLATKDSSSLSGRIFLNNRTAFAVFTESSWEPLRQWIVLKRPMNKSQFDQKLFIQYLEFGKSGLLSPKSLARCEHLESSFYNSCTKVPLGKRHKFKHLNTSRFTWREAAQAFDFYLRANRRTSGNLNKCVQAKKTIVRKKYLIALVRLCPRKQANDARLQRAFPFVWVQIHVSSPNLLTQFSKGFPSS